MSHEGQRKEISQRIEQGSVESDQQRVERRVGSVHAQIHMENGGRNRRHEAVDRHLRHIQCPRLSSRCANEKRLQPSKTIQILIFI